MSDLSRRSEPAGTQIDPAGPTEVTIDGETVSRFSHQLRSLLTSVGAAADYLLRNEIEQGVRNEMLGIISEQATRIDGLLDDFLVVTSPGADGVAGASAVDIYQIARKVVRHLAGEAQSVGAWLVLDTGGAIPPVVGRHRPLQQALTGALRAVLSLTRPGERVVARLEEARGESGEKFVQLSVTVQSDDPGLFDRTSRLSPTDLSLQAARRVSEQHGGTFETLEDEVGLACRLPVASLEICPTAALRPPRQIEACGS